MDDALTERQRVGSPHIAARSPIGYQFSQDTGVNDSASADLRATSQAFFALTITSALALAGCTSSGIDIGEALEAVPSTMAAEAAELPESAPAPTAREAAAEIAEPEATVGVAAVAAEKPAEAKPDILASVSSSYAGPTPTTIASIAPPVTASLAPRIRDVKANSPELDRLISHYSDHYDVPVELVRRVVKRESNFNPAARNRTYWGLMQIHPATAKSMGYKGSPEGLLDADTNLRYAVRYLRGAYLVADGNHDQAVRFYSRGYYYDAKRKGLLDETGLGRDRRS